MSLAGFIESRCFYFPSRSAFETPRGVEDVRFQTTDGLTLHGWFLHAAGHAGSECQPTILHVHGNAGNLEGHIAFSGWLTARGFNVLAFDYRGFGRSDEPSRGLVRADLLADARAALGFLRRRPEVDAARVGLLGVSLGGVIALALAVEDPGVRCIVSISAFATWRGIAGEKMPVLGSMLVSGGMDAAASAAALGQRPLLVVHGENDTIVPPSHARTIEAAARTAGVPVRRDTLSGVGHNDVLIDDRATQDIVARFFAESLRQERASGTS
jgi:dipeptidyl aminopeptidase/acylaminoacyl peptidase